ncbi:cartilage matrix protein-like [Saccostrea echinata]|uniref:cartilage matrix protein-like n=1 Tax=Saccostrea echinata TaxID=191078 RepID=UPI002A83B668|nr:cartilage matrix protein-like [Saccostrea echinata]
MERRVKYLLVVIFASLAIGATQISGNVCTKKMADVVFLMDSSFSVWEQDFKMQLQFVTSVVDNFQIGNDSVQVGVLSYSSEIKTNFFLNEYREKEDMKDAVGKIEYLGVAGTDTAGALKYAREVMFHKKHGGRATASKILILITDGMSQNSNETVKQAAITKQAGINILAVAVGAPIMKELEMVASNPATDFVFNVTDFNSLPSIVNSLATTTCLVPDIPRDGESTINSSEIEEKIKKYCGNKPSDILFVVDSSSSIWPLHFQDILNFIQKVIGLFDVNDDKNRIGIIIYSDEVTPVLHLDNQLNSNELKKRVSNIQQLKGGTETGNALKYARENEFKGKYERKTVAKKVIILLTDGQSIKPKDTLEEATQLKNENITVFAIGIGNRTDKEELKAIATSARHQYSLQDYNALSTIKNMLVVKTCTVHFQVQDPTIEDNTGSEETCWDSARDVMFVFDSPVIGAHKTKIIRKAITEMFKLMQIGSNKTKAGLLSHYCPTNLDTSLEEFQNEQSFLLGLKRHPNDGLKRLLRILRTRGFQHKDDKPVKKVGIIFVDREEHDSHGIIEEARRTALNSRLFVITIGNRVPSHTVESLCSDFKHRCVFHISQYNSLIQYVPDIMDMVCYS